jgi:hypothetical protein
MSARTFGRCASSPTFLMSIARHDSGWTKSPINEYTVKLASAPAIASAPDCLRSLPGLAPDYRDTAEVFVQKDLRLQFDGNRYCAPPHLVGQRLLVKADASSVTLYHRNQEIVRYPRCWRRGQTFGAERFEKELLAQRAAGRGKSAQVVRYRVCKR